MLWHLMLMLAICAPTSFGGCHGPAWLPKTRACKPLPFGKAVLSTTPIAFSDADLFSIGISKDERDGVAEGYQLGAVFFQLTFNVQPVSLPAV